MQEKKFEEMTIEQYNELLASNVPAPGGGSALCQIAVTACSLIEMAVNVTLPKASEENRIYLSSQRETVVRAKKALQRLSNDDAAAFRRIADGFKLPKNTEEEQKTRAAELQKAYHNAALTPLDAMGLSREVVRTACLRIQPLLSKYVASDCTIGIALLKTAVRSSMLNVRANTALIKDEYLAETLNKRGEQIVAETEKI